MGQALVLHCKIGAFLSLIIKQTNKQMPQNAAFYLGLRCYMQPVYRFKGTQYKR